MLCFDISARSKGDIQEGKPYLPCSHCYEYPDTYIIKYQMVALSGSPLLRLTSRTKWGGGVVEIMCHTEKGRRHFNYEAASCLEQLIWLQTGILVGMNEGGNCCTCLMVSFRKQD